MIRAPRSMDPETLARFTKRSQKAQRRYEAEREAHRQKYAGLYPSFVVPLGRGKHDRPD